MREVADMQVKKDATVLITQLVLISSSNVLCWSPTNGVYIAAMSVPSYPIEMIIWTLDGSMPLNSY